MDTDDKGQSGYYQTIARAFLERRGGPFFLSPKDQSTIAGWEARGIPLGVVLEGIGRTFDGLVARGRGTRGVSLSTCERHVDAAFGQHRDRSAGRRRAAPAEPRSGKKDKARREIEKSLPALAADPAVWRLLRTALDVLDTPTPDEAVLERIDGEVEDILWDRATEAEKGAAGAELRRGRCSKRSAAVDAMVRRKVVQASRADRRIPHVSLYYY